MGHDSWSTSTLLLELEPRFTLEVYQVLGWHYSENKGSKKIVIQNRLSIHFVRWQFKIILTRTYLIIYPRIEGSNAWLIEMGEYMGIPFYTVFLYSGISICIPNKVKFWAFLSGEHRCLFCRVSFAAISHGFLNWGLTVATLFYFINRPVAQGHPIYANLIKVPNLKSIYSMFLHVSSCFFNIRNISRHIWDLSTTFTGCHEVSKGWQLRHPSSQGCPNT